ncbi:MAG: acetylglutamate kinase [Fusobacteriaceae bacterium]|jgi:acetylglutamate kinase|nr:N-acetylglutamate kinase [Fusobacteriales bacterium]MDN5305001.1 acetylglutamate kinase [Fusobacteriaceae bacterium]
MWFRYSIILYKLKILGEYMEKLIEKANILVEAMPYIKEFSGKTIVIKYGGSAMTDEKLKQDFIRDIVLMKYVGMNPVIVHGGGPAINEMLKKVNKEVKFVEGNRVTDRETVELVEMVLSGKVNKDIVSIINKNGGKAIGLSGKDSNLILAEKKYIEKNNEKIDIGYVGKVKKINIDIVNTLLEKGYIPVICPVGTDEEGATYNINADYVAGEIAGALKADKFIFVTDVMGIMKDIKDENSLINKVTEKEVEELIKDEIIVGGMLPKVSACLNALDKGAGRVHIVNGKIEHSLLLEIFTKQGIGTMIVK